MIDLIVGHIIEDIDFWVMSAIAIVSNILLHRQKKAYIRLDETHQRLRLDLLRARIGLKSVVNTVNDFIDEHNYWHDRKIRFYYDQDGWQCCYDDEMPQSDTFITEEEITPLNEKRQ